MGRLTGQSLRLPGDEPRRRGGLRRQRLVARRPAVGGAQRDLAADRSGAHRGGSSGKEDRRPQPCDRAWHDHLSGPAGPAHLRLLDARGSAANYDDGSSFQIGRIDMVANTGTYLDAPFHRYADGNGPRRSAARLARRPARDRRSTAVGERTSRSTPRLRRARRRAARRCWSTPAGTGTGAPTATARTTRSSPRRRPTGWSSMAPRWSASTATISTTRASARARSTRILLGAGIPICEHMTGLGQLPDEGFRFTAVPPKVARHGHLPGARLCRARLSERASSQSGMIALSGMASTRAWTTERPSSRIFDAACGRPPPPRPRTAGG